MVWPRKRTRTAAHNTDTRQWPTQDHGSHSADNTAAGGARYQGTAEHTQFGGDAQALTPCDPPAPDQRDHRGAKRNLQSGRSDRGICGTQTFGTQTPHPPPSPTPPSRTAVPVGLRSPTIVGAESARDVPLHQVCVGGRYRTAAVLHGAWAPASAQRGVHPIPPGGWGSSAFRWFSRHLNGGGLSIGGRGGGSMEPPG